MAGLQHKIDRSVSGFSLKKTVLCVICLSVLIFISALLQTTCLSFFGKVPALTFAIVCAVGFLCGEKMGAFLGIFAGMMTDMIGSTGISLSPILFMLCGYICGACVGWFLSENLPSFIVYAVLAGIFREIFTVICYGLFSEDFELWQIVKKLLVPEYFSYLVCVLPAYGAVWGILTLIKGKNNRRKRSF